MEPNLIPSNPFELFVAFKNKDTSQVTILENEKAMKIKKK